MSGRTPRTAPPARLDTDDVEACMRVLRAIDADRGVLAELSEERRRELLTLAGLVARPERHQLVRMAKAFRRAEREAARREDRAAIERAGLRIQRRAAVYQPLWLPPPGPDEPRQGTGLRNARACYVCKQPYTQVHRYYDSMCVACGDFNYAKREQTADLRGRWALVTGARVKIGYQASLKLLRAGAHVVVTTRFPVDAADRYAREPGYPDFAARLQIHGLDLRHTPSVELFARFLAERLPRLDYLLNNACQTVRRPAGFYRHLVARESTAFADLPEALRGPLAQQAELCRVLGSACGSFTAATATTARPTMAGPTIYAPTAGTRADARSRAFGGSKQPSSPAPVDATPRPLSDGLRHASGLLHSAALSQSRWLDEDYRDGDTAFPAGRYDEDLQQLDLRDTNSWRLRLHEVETPELLEVQLVNAVAPYVLVARLRPLLAHGGGRHMHVVNVSAMEGQFYRTTKTDRHPHTNMAKAALNMMTRTSAPDFVRDGIHMNAVDTGWVTDEDPAVHAARKAEEGFAPRLDVIDGAARIVDPIFDGERTGTHVWGQFLKDYRPVAW